MNLFESFKTALRSIRANKTRSFLTMLGIIIGISSVIAVVSLGQGGQNAIQQEFFKIGASAVRISVDTTKATPGDYITLEDVRTVKEWVETVRYVSPTMQKRGIVTSEQESHNTIIYGGSPDLIFINNTEILYGRYFNEREYEEGNGVAIIDKVGAQLLFGFEDVVGEAVNISDGNFNTKLKIIGVEEGISVPFGGMGNRHRPVSLTVPFTYFSQLQSAPLRISNLTLMADSQENVELAGRGAIDALETRHNNRGMEIYSAETTLNMLNQLDAVLGIFTTFVGAVAGISLLVGGIGVMNIMLVSVTERTREIGIRKAIGATTNTILFQFLVEAVLISVIGGVIGMVLGIIGAEVIGRFAGITPAISVGIIFLALLFSSAVGIFFGIYPAKRAAQLDPIEALRYE